MFNGTDVYVQVAKHLFREELAEQDLQLSVEDFKQQHKTLRAKAKSYILGSIYGMSPSGIAKRLKISSSEAQREYNNFKRAFPKLQRAIQQARENGMFSGFTTVCSGLRRYRARTGELNFHERNWLTNTPVQGSAAVAFKLAGIRLFQRYQHYEAKLILALHDAFVFECPQEHLVQVAEITREVMVGAVQEIFPTLAPRVDMNISQPDCWNKDGDAGSFERWLEAAEEIKV